MVTESDKRIAQKTKVFSKNISYFDDNFVKRNIFEPTHKFQWNSRNSDKNIIAKLLNLRESIKMKFAIINNMKNDGMDRECDEGWEFSIIEEIRNR